MSPEQKHHEELVNGFHSQLKQIFDSSEQAIYLYLDDTHKVCNKKWASLFGYVSPEEWAKTEHPLDDIEKRSQDTVVSAYQNAMEKKVASQIEIRGKKKAGGTITLSLIMVPVVYQEHLFALHFAAEK